MEKVLKRGKTLIIANAFSISMIKKEEEKIKFRKITEEEAKEIVKNAKEVESIIGHEGTAEVFGAKLGVGIKPNRVFYKLKKGEILLVGSLNQRLPEGKVLSTAELEKIPIQWWIVEII